MHFVDHHRVVKTSVRIRVELPDQTLHRVLVVETDMPISEGDVDYNAEEFGKLVNAITAAMERSGAEKAEIIKAET